MIILGAFKLLLFINISSHRGTFRMERPDGSNFDVRIPPFSLESKQEDPMPIV